MTMKFSFTGRRRIQQRFKALQQASRQVMRDVSKEVNRRHALTMRRRAIPERTGRLKGSLTQESHPDRQVTVTNRSVQIESTVPYAEHQAKRIRKLNAAENKEVFLKPVEEKFDAVIKGGRGS